MSTRFTVRLNGGPLEGTRVFNDEDFLWPPPDRFPDPDGEGEYRITNYSELGPTDPERDHLIRGAEYEWFPWRSEEVS